MQFILSKEAALKWQIMGLFWEHFVTILGPFGTILRKFCDNIGTIFGPFWDPFGTILGIHWDNFGTISGTF